jgi:hypothetical protein
MTRFHVDQQNSNWFHAYVTDAVLKTAQKDNFVQWLLVVDIDEFRFGPAQNQTMAHVLSR